ncbi:MAG: site-2 protease family protein, partial [Deltaproteobacteria bacterium]|nr:site-2 protease family protein [Deltaproteobacteria bacterium]
MTILAFLITLGVLIIVHELGHFLVAKWCGIGVEEFSVGFGPRLFGMKKGGTDYRLSLIPLGGYVKMKGEEEDDKTPPASDSFAGQSVRRRAAVILCGPVMNLVLCLLLMPAVYMIGRTMPAYLFEPPVVIDVHPETSATRAGLQKGDRLLSIDGEGMETWEQTLNTIILAPGKKLSVEWERNGTVMKGEVLSEELTESKRSVIGIEPSLFLGREPVIDDVTAMSPAAKAGLQSGDRVTAYNGSPISDWNDLAEKINTSEGKSVELTVARGADLLTVSLTPSYDQEAKRWLIGIRKDIERSVPMIKKRYGPIDALVEGWKEVGRLTALTFDIVRRLVTLDLSYKVLGGPIMIATSTAQA